MYEPLTAHMAAVASQTVAESLGPANVSFSQLNTIHIHGDGGRVCAFFTRHASSYLMLYFYHKSASSLDRATLVKRRGGAHRHSSSSPFLAWPQIREGGHWEQTRRSSCRLSRGRGKRESCASIIWAQRHRKEFAHSSSTKRADTCYPVLPRVGLWSC